MKTSHVETPLTSLKPEDMPHTQTVDPAWKPLYKVGGVAALIVVMLIVISIPIFIIWPPPGGLLPTSSTVIDCFTLFQKNWLLGLLGLDLVMLASAVLGIPIYLALYAALRRASPSFMAIALTLGLVGIPAYFAANPAFSMLSLSNQYAAATSDAQRSLFVAAGQAILANYQGTGFDMYYILGAVATLLISAVMLRNAPFSKKTAYVGIAAGVLMLVPPTVGTIGVYLSLISLVALVIWYVLIARRLLMLAQDKSRDVISRA